MHHMVSGTLAPLYTVFGLKLGCSGAAAPIGSIRPSARPFPPLRAQEPASQALDPASQASEPARQASEPASQASEPASQASEALRPAWLALRPDWMGLRPAWLALGPLRGGTDIRMDGRTYGRTDGRKISPFYRTSSPIGAAAQKPPYQI